MKKSNTRRALLLSVISLMLCISMLIGTTYAWFTDTVTSAGNKIVAGTLELDLLLLDKEDNTTWTSIKEDRDPIFNYEKWEPGYTDVKVLKVENKGSLALKWKATAEYDGVMGILADVIDVYVKPGVTAYPTDRVDLSDWQKVGTVREFVTGIATSTYGTLQKETSATLGIALKMRESAGNEYQKEILGAFDITILATQLAYEEDSFDKNYDEDAEYPAGTYKNLGEEKILNEDNVTVVVPAGAEDGYYELGDLNKSIVEENGVTTIDLDITPLVDGDKVGAGMIPYEVTIQVAPMATINKLTHNGQEIPANEYEYDAFTGVLTFETTSFSPFSVVYEVFSTEYEADIETKTITGGYFDGVNPATIDPSLAEETSEYVVIDYEKNGETCYVVSPKATTMLVYDADEMTADQFANKSYKDLVVGVAGNNLWENVFSGLRTKDGYTVYILPGNYPESTTLTVETNMEIAGLGDKEDIKVVKGESEGSNRHLFNCTNSYEYIQVVIRNMTLDVPCDNIKNGSAQDNAAVQSIRKAKVKCYDLIVNKAPATVTLENAAFYINSNNKAADGKLYPAYLYVENTVVNSTNENYKHKVYATNGSKNYFNHYGLKYDAGAKELTTNSGKIKNIQMAADDWDWEN